MTSMHWTLADIAAASGGELRAADGAAVVQRISTDTRQSVAGALFVALKGENFDGHDYAAAAVVAGAVAVLVSTAADAARAELAGLPRIVVTEPQFALGRLAAAWRARFGLPVIAVTGSNGKTTVKEMIAAILRAEFGSEGAVLATVGNLNNQIGLPLTLLGLRAAHRAAVVEIGMNQPGEILYLTRIAQPTVALVNNAQSAHLGGLGSLEAIALEKADIYQGVAANGVAVVNADERFAPLWSGFAGTRRVLRFGLSGKADVTASWEATSTGSVVIATTPAGALRFTLGIPGDHNVRNALAAIAATLAAGISAAAIQRALDGFAGVKGRLQRKPGLGGAVLIDDSYNANPDSVRAAIRVLAAQPGTRRLILGDMGELGPTAPALHAEVGDFARLQGIERFDAVGELMKSAVATFGAGGCHWESVDALLAGVSVELDATTTVLVKGSRFMRMERVVAGLLAPVAGEAGAPAGEKH